MEYNLNFPLPLDMMRDSQPLMLENFSEIYNFFGVDHFNFDTAIIPSPSAGKHVKLTMTQQNKDTIPAPDATDYFFFQALSALTNSNQLYSKDSLGNIFQFSDALLDENEQVNWFSLPSGLIVKWVDVVVDFDLDTGGQQGQSEYTLTWPLLAKYKPFTNQYWGIVLPVQESGSLGIRTVAYVNEISDPTKVRWNLWLSSRFNNDTLFVPRFDSEIRCTVLVIGV